MLTLRMHTVVEPSKLGGIIFANNKKLEGDFKSWNWSAFLSLGEWSQGQSIVVTMDAPITFNHIGVLMASS